MILSRLGIGWMWLCYQLKSVPLPVDTGRMKLVLLIIAIVGLIWFIAHWMRCATQPDRLFLHVDETLPASTDREVTTDSEPTRDTHPA